MSITEIGPTGQLKFVRAKEDQILFCLIFIISKLMEIDLRRGGKYPFMSSLISPNTLFLNIFEWIPGDMTIYQGISGPQSELLYLIC